MARSRQSTSGEWPYGVSTTLVNTMLKSCEIANSTEVQARSAQAILSSSPTSKAVKPPFHKNADRIGMGITLVDLAYKTREITYNEKTL